MLFKIQVINNINKHSIMKKLSLILATLSVISLLTQCQDPGDRKLKSPNTSFKYYIASDTTKKENPETVTNTQSIVFEATNYDGADYYSVYVGSFKIGTDEGVSLEKNEKTKVFNITHAAIPEVGTYKIYMVATNVNLATGKISQKVDSSKSIIVVDPTVSQAIITAFPIMQAGVTIKGKTSGTLSVASSKVGFPITPRITSDSIVFEELNPKWFPIFRSVYVEPKATSIDIFINDSVNVDTYTPLSMNSKVGNYFFKGCKIKIVSKDGTATKIYPIGISYIKL